MNFQGFQRDRTQKMASSEILSATAGGCEAVVGRLVQRDRTGGAGYISRAYQREGSLDSLSLGAKGLPVPGAFDRSKKQNPRLQTRA